MENIILDKLSENKLFYVGITEVIKRKTAIIQYFSKNALIVLDTVSGACMVDSKNRESAEKALKMVDTSPLFVAYQKHSIDLIREKYKLELKLVCNQAAYFESAPPTYNKNLDIRLLGLEHLDFASENYGITEEDYIRGRIEAGQLFGVFIDGEIGGFAGVHEEGSLGLLVVTEKFRRRQLGYNLTAFVMNHIMSGGRVPFSQISISNHASYNLHKKLNFSISDEKLYWLY